MVWLPRPRARQAIGWWEGGVSRSVGRGPRDLRPRMGRGGRPGLRGAHARARVQRHSDPRSVLRSAPCMRRLLVSRPGEGLAGRLGTRHADPVAGGRRGKPRPLLPGTPGPGRGTGSGQTAVRGRPGIPRSRGGRRDLRPLVGGRVRALGTPRDGALDADGVQRMGLGRRGRSWVRGSGWGGAAAARARSQCRRGSSRWEARLQGTAIRAGAARKGRDPLPRAGGRSGTHPRVPRRTSPWAEGAASCHPRPTPPTPRAATSPSSAPPSAPRRWWSTPGSSGFSRSRGSSPLTTSASAWPSTGASRLP